MHTHFALIQPTPTAAGLRVVSNMMENYWESSREIPYHQKANGSQFSPQNCPVSYHGSRHFRVDLS